MQSKGAIFDHRELERDRTSEMSGDDRSGLTQREMSVTSQASVGLVN